MSSHPHVIGTRIDSTTAEQALTAIESWARDHESRYACFANVHVVTTARRDATLRDALAASDLVLPDGMPVAWAVRRGSLEAVMLGVGAAFDFHAGTIDRAPAWMRDRGLEWLHRLVSEPRRLWKRYLVTNTTFLVLLAIQLGHRTARHARRRH